MSQESFTKYICNVAVLHSYRGPRQLGSTVTQLVNVSANAESSSSMTTATPCPEVIKLFFMLSSSKPEVYHAQKS